MDGPVARTAFNATEPLRDCVRNTATRVVGAPRGSWAGRSVTAPHARLASSMRVFEMVFEQAQALGTERVASTLASGDVSEFWVTQDATVRNAYAVLPIRIVPSEALSRKSGWSSTQSNLPQSERVWNPN
jgi:hypothetical protein